MAGPHELVGPFPDGVDPAEYDRLRRRVLWQLVNGLYLLGTSCGDEKNLMTLNWAMQVSIRPKQVAVSVETSALTHRLLSNGGCFALSLLDRGDRALVRSFVKPARHDLAESRLNDVAYTTKTTGAPIVEAAVAWIDCEVGARLACGSHELFIGEVVNAGGGGSEAVLRMEDTRMSYGG